MADNDSVIEDAPEPHRHTFSAILGSFVAKFHHTLLRELSRKMPTHAAGDVLQAAYLSLLAKPPEPGKIGSIRNYIRGVLRYRVCDWIRQQQQLRLIESELMRVALEGVPMQVPSAEAYVCMAQGMEMQLAILNDEDPEGMLAFELVRLQGLSVQQAADRMGMSRHQVSRCLCRVLLRLEAFYTRGEPR